MDTETQAAAETVAAVIAEEAAAIVETSNDEAAQAEVVNNALLEAAIEGAQVRRVEEFERQIREHCERMMADYNAAIERLVQCEMSLTEQAAVIVELRSAQPLTLEIPLNQEPSKRQSADAEDLERPEPSATNPSTLESPPEPKAAPPAKKRSTTLL